MVGIRPGGNWDVVGSRSCGGVCPGGDWDVMGSSLLWEFVVVGNRPIRPCDGLGLLGLGPF